MSEHQALKKALRQMAEGSRSAFHTFYNGTSQFVYSYARMLCQSHEDACRFLVDFYQYLYLHLPEYEPSQELDGWISRLLMERYEQLSIGRQTQKPSVQQQMNATVTQLSPSEQERVWRMLDVAIHFPKEPARRSPVQIILFLSLLLLLLLIASRYVPAAIERLQAANAVLNAGNSSDEEENSENPDSGANDQADELDSIRQELDDLLDERTGTEAVSTEDANDGLQMQQSSRDTAGSDEIQTPSTPEEPKTPQTPDAPKEPQEPQSPSLDERSGAASDIDDLEDLELELYYGNGLIHAGSN